MNKAIFLYTFVRHMRIPSLIGLAAFIFVLPVLFSFLCVTEDMTTVLLPMLFGPAMSMVIAYTFVQYTVANNRSINDGEYLALVFSRPITRANYVATKWAAGAVAVSAVTILQLCIFAGCIWITGRPVNIIINPYILADLLLNAAGYSALVVLISVFPMRLGVIFFLCLTYFVLLGSIIPSVIDRAATPWSTLGIAGGISTFFQLMRTVLTPSIDTYQLCSAVVFSWLPIVSYLSNICIYLLFAILIINKREFFYAAE